MVWRVRLKSDWPREERIGRAGLRPAEDYYRRFPYELSGGQRQRVVIAGALVLQPELLIADEPVSMLDVSIRADILNLLRGLREHAASASCSSRTIWARWLIFADRLAVMYLGRIVEVGATREVLQNPQHPYTRALLSVVPVPNPRERRERVILQGETRIPSTSPRAAASIRAAQSRLIAAKRSIRHLWKYHLRIEWHVCWRWNAGPMRFCACQPRGRGL